MQSSSTTTNEAQSTPSVHAQEIPDSDRKQLAALAQAKGLPVSVLEGRYIQALNQPVLSHVLVRERGGKIVTRLIPYNFPIQGLQPGDRFYYRPSLLQRARFQAGFLWQYVTGLFSMARLAYWVREFIKSDS